MNRAELINETGCPYFPGSVANTREKVKKEGLKKMRQWRSNYFCRLFFIGVVLLVLQKGSFAEQLPLRPDSLSNQRPAQEHASFHQRNQEFVNRINDVMNLQREELAPDQMMIEATGSTGLPQIFFDDLDHSGDIDIIDVVLVIKNMGNSGPEDLNRDGLVTLLDVIQVIGHFGENVASHLLSSFQQGDYQARKEIISAVAAIKKDWVLPVLIEGLGDVSMPSHYWSNILRKGEKWEIRFGFTKERIPQEAYGKEITFSLKDDQGKEIASTTSSIVSEDRQYDLILSSAQLIPGEYRLEISFRDAGIEQRLQSLKVNVIQKDESEMEFLIPYQYVWFAAQTELLKRGDRIDEFWIQGITHSNPMIRIGILHIMEFSKYIPESAFPVLFHIFAPSEFSAERLAVLDAVKNGLAADQAAYFCIIGLVDSNSSIRLRSENWLDENKEIALPILLSALDFLELDTALREQIKRLLKKWSA